MLTSSFQTSLKVTIEPGKVCCGRFDGEKLSIAIASNGNKILIHTPGVPEPKILNMNRQVTVIASASLDASQPLKDFLLVGSSSSLLAYDVYDNADKFFVDVQDGVYTIAVGSLGGKDLIFVGGNCSLQGFDSKGSEEFWTVVGGTTRSLTISDFERKSRPCLVCGSDDFELRVFSSEQSDHEITETESVTHLCTLGDGVRIAYGLANGTVGVYEGNTRVWRVKLRDNIRSMIAFDIDGDGVDEVIIGWSNGRMEARRDEDGSLVYRESLGHSVNGLLKTDYRNTGEEELVCCMSNGDLRGYTSVSTNKDELVQVYGRPQGNVDTKIYIDDEDSVGNAVRGAHQEAFKKVQHYEQNNKEMQSLQEKLTVKTMELRSLEEQLQNSQATGSARLMGSLPDDTRLTVLLTSNLDKKQLELKIDTNSKDCLIHSVLLFDFDGGIFENECLALHVNPPSSSVLLPLHPLKDCATILKIQVFSSARGSAENIHVLEALQELRKFSMLSPGELKISTTSKKSVNFVIQSTFGEILNALSLWLNIDERKKIVNELSLELPFVNLRTGEAVRFEMHSLKGSKIRFIIQGLSMESAGEVIQSLAHELHIDTLESVAEFSSDMERVRSLLSVVAEHQLIRQRLGAEMADESHYIKSLIIKAEDSRQLEDISNIRETYQECTTLNAKLIAEYNKRANNQTGMMDALREVKKYIQSAAMLRVGDAQGAVISAARKALKAQNATALCMALTSG